MAKKKVAAKKSMKKGAAPKFGSAAWKAKYGKGKGGKSKK